MTQIINDAELRAEQDRLLSEGRRVHLDAMQVIRAAEKQPLPKSIRDSINEFKQLLARADIMYGAARNLNLHLETMRKIARQMRAISGQALGSRADSLRAQTDIMDKLGIEVRTECDRAIRLADEYQEKARVARIQYERAKAAYNAKNRHSGDSYDDYLWNKQEYEREAAEANADFDWSWVDFD